jgi:hypothetical protein
MSRGPGHIERTILGMAEHHPMLVPQIARQAYGLARAGEVTPTHCQAVRRALRKLEQAGIVARIHDEQLGRWRWRRINLAALERANQRQQRELARRRKAEEREAAIQAANATSPGAVTRLLKRPSITPSLPYQTEAVWVDEPRQPRVRMTRRRSQRAGRPRNIGQLWAYDVTVPEAHELSQVIAVITRLWAGLHEADRVLAFQLLEKLPNTKITRIG